MQDEMKGWLNWHIDGPRPWERCGCERLRANIRIFQGWLEEFETYRSPNAVQFKQDLREAIANCNERLQKLERKKEEEERVRKEAMKASEEEDSRKGKNTDR
jgi:hypothetical protein